MKFSRTDADIYVPGEASAPEAALASVTHLCIAAHQDDIEIMAYAGIVDCLQNPKKKFGGVVATNGSGSPRTGRFASMTDEQMQTARRAEQRKASDLGKYAIQIQLAHPSSQVKTPSSSAVADDLLQILSICRPEVLYVHNPADKHDTHVALLLRCFEAIQALPRDKRPLKVLGCEVWRDLDWLPDPEKVALDSGKDPALASDLLKVFESQIGGGKRYDYGTLGRRAANATFHSSHATDDAEGLTWAIDLTETARSQEPCAVETHILSAIDRFREDVARRLRSFAK